MNKIALITGATAGIGEATAVLLAKNNFDLIITGRREERLLELKTKLEKEHQVNVLSLRFDIRNQDEVKDAIHYLPDEWKNNINVLINNAGLAVGLDHVQDGNTEDWERMIDTNIKGLLYITREVSPLMVKNKKGHIINIGSIAGKEVYERGNVYCASKHAVDALSKAMRIDMLKHGVKVTNIAPGKVETEFSMVRFKGDKEKADKVYESYKSLTAMDVAESILFVITRPAHVNINDLIITPTDQANSHYQN